MSYNCVTGSGNRFGSFEKDKKRPTAELHRERPTAELHREQPTARSANDIDFMRRANIQTDIQSLRTYADEAHPSHQIPERVAANPNWQRFLPLDTSQSTSSRERIAVSRPDQSETNYNYHIGDRIAVSRQGQSEYQPTAMDSERERTEAKIAQLQKWKDYYETKAGAFLLHYTEVNSSNTPDPAKEKVLKAFLIQEYYRALSKHNENNILLLMEIKNNNSRHYSDDIELQRRRLNELSTRNDQSSN